MAGKAKTVKNSIKGSLTFQVVGLYWFVLILIFAINGLMVYRFSIRQKIEYYKKTADYYARDFASVMEDLMPSDWLLNYWNEHPEALSRAATSDLEDYRDVYNQFDAKYGYEWEYILTSSDVQSMSQEEQEALSKYYYEDIRKYASYTREETRIVIKGPIIAGGRAGEPLRVYYSDSEVYNFAPGEVLNIPEKQLKQALSDSETAETVSDPVLSTIQIIGIPGKRETVNGVSCRIAAGGPDLVSLVIMGVDEAYLKKESAGAILRMIVIDILISVLLGFVLMYILYLLILRPVTRIQKGLHVYVENGDTDQVVKTMGSVQAGNEIGRLAGDIGNMVQVLEAHVRARQQLEDEQEKLAAELENAARIQMAMLPKVFPDRSLDPRLELYASMVPAREVGGDLYDFFMVDPDNLALVIADVSGKGIPAALFMMEAKTLVREITRPDIPLDEIMGRVNHRLCAFNEEQQFITTWMMTVNLTTGKALEVNSGHTKPVLSRCQNSYKLVRNTHDLPLGIRDNLTFTVHEWQLEPGDRIFVYTDGVSEAENGSREQFGTDRMLAALNEKCQASQKETLDFVSDSVRAFVGAAPQTDDMTMMGMTFFGNS